jgi:hypothetical protein
LVDNKGDAPSPPKGKLLQFPAKKPVPLKVVETTTFKNFHLLVVQSKLAEASAALAVLLGVPLKRAEAAAHYYAKKAKEDTQHPFKTMQLSGVIAQGAPNEALLLLQECFGLEGPIAIQVYETLRQASKM